MPYGSNMTISAALVIEMVGRIVELEAYLQKVQADRINDIAIERKRWAKADLVALEILRLEQQAKGLSEGFHATKEPIGRNAFGFMMHYCSEKNLKDRVDALRKQAQALKEPNL
jgi:hypothetical protein